MPNLGEGDKSWQRVKDLVEALLDYKLNNRNDITHLDAQWEDETTTHLYVTATLESLRHLLKDKNALNAFKPNKTTSDKQVRLYIGEVLNNYLDKNLKILKNHIPKSKRRGNSNRIFTLNLWSQKDKAKNLEELAKVWGGTPDNSRQNTEGKTEKDDVPADCPPDKSIRVAVSQMPESVPVWKGRDELVANLTAKLVEILPDGTLPPKVLAIVGQGGMGKTSLAIKLVEGLGMNWQHSVSQAGKSFLGGGYECVMYFKAYEKISFDEVAGFLLSEGLGIQGVAELKKPEEKIAKIMVGLQQTRCLLVLDNLEDILYPAVEAENLDSFDSSCLTVIGAIHRDFGNWDLGEKYFKDALSIAKEDNKSHIGNSLGMLGDIERNLGNWDEAERLYRQSLALRTELGDRKGIVSCWGLLGNIEQCRGNWDEAERLYRQALALRTELGDREGIAMLIGDLGENELARGNIDTAEQLLTEALGKMQKQGMTWHIAETNYDLARLHRKRGNTEVAQQHYDTAHQIFQQLGAAKDVEKIEKEWHKSD